MARFSSAASAFSTRLPRFSVRASAGAASTTGTVFRVARSRDGATDWRFDPHPLLEAQPDLHPEEVWGCEDPRVTKIGDTYYIFYTALGGRAVGSRTLPAQGSHRLQSRLHLQDAI